VTCQPPLPKPEGLNNNSSRAFFSVQNLIETRAFDAMTPRKSGLISLALNRGSQQLNNFAVIKYEQVTA
jgi:hypothetical protein